MSAICLPDGFDSGDLLRHAYRRYGISLGAGLSRVAGRVFRIGHLGDLNEIMLLSALAGAEMALRDLAVPVAARHRQQHGQQPEVFGRLLPRAAQLQGRPRVRCWREA